MTEEQKEQLEAAKDEIRTAHQAVNQTEVDSESVAIHLMNAVNLINNAIRMDE